MNPETARVAFAGFPQALKAAMKGAAIRNAWSAETWPMQVSLVAEALLRGNDPEVMATAYSTVIEDR
ncbi:MAG: hypothetical protein IPK54_10450 [Dokdonella sp.]|uniref:hypothetical protein n=1 Tax=Dokdonella sp. TaxID=2291710 RepID=UPI0025B808EE|nr:hypothetical protein [Dokdonella sp.]MBK8123951.1 hypothetical protein [Dokdonella sp.]